MKAYVDRHRHSELEEAISIYDGLDAEYKELKTRNWASRLEYLRVSLGRVIIAYLDVNIVKATQLWQDFQVSVRYCREHHQVTGFLEMVIDYCLCDLAARLEDYNEAHRMLKRAKPAFQYLGREHWWTCIDTDFLDLVRDSLLEKNLISGIDQR
ncbi:uncharacterized protein N7446_010548 [Penicillium canescens]|uniref:Uncharacterized protein n=1 Tax=Penicillium canescens TaxID=5083 RepID=A0AAD6IBN2_PENCN|nr:uncharacterized protein N7446_010548 [Penicillium canescens]KAJ6041569.1 hypothetical protein N7460_006959 [Penicillium canescens]KAJ6050439.1 hypothetical protein N7446_010548 [Penicillium canescens]KAJ6064742.1 hypothetical protein N7444_000395 [Penicillium canescens]